MMADYVRELTTTEFVPGDRVEILQGKNKGKTGTFIDYTEDGRALVRSDSTGNTKPFPRSWLWLVSDPLNSGAKSDAATDSSVVVEAPDRLPEVTRKSSTSSEATVVELSTTTRSDVGEPSTSSDNNVGETSTTRSTQVGELHTKMMDVVEAAELLHDRLHLLIATFDQLNCDRAAVVAYKKGKSTYYRLQWREGEMIYQKPIAAREKDGHLEAHARYLQLKRWKRLHRRYEQWLTKVQTEEPF